MHTHTHAHARTNTHRHVWACSYSGSAALAFADGTSQQMCDWCDGEASLLTPPDYPERWQTLNIILGLAPTSVFVAFNLLDEASYFHLLHF